MFLFIIPSKSRLSCKNMQDKNVDYFYMFKLPVVKDDVPLHATGTAYFYRDASTRLSESSGNVDDKTTNPLYYTMRSLFPHTDKSIGYVFVTDQPPTGTIGASYAHMKGVMMFDKDNGLYIEHSAPKWPQDPETEQEYYYTQTSKKYAQNFHCNTLSHEDLEKVAQGWRIEKPGVYATNIPNFTATAIPTIQQVLDKKWDTENPTKKFSLKVGGETIQLYAKSGPWGGELYHDYLAPDLEQDLYAQTWPNGVGNLPSNCSGEFSAFSVTQLAYAGIPWARTKDHSKWCVAGDWYCVGGINRQASQARRGGGAWCRHHPALAKEMKNVIQQFEQCETE